MINSIITNFLKGCYNFQVYAARPLMPRNGLLAAGYPAAVLWRYHWNLHVMVLSRQQYKDVLPYLFCKSHKRFDL